MKAYSAIFWRDKLIFLIYMQVFVYQMIVYKSDMHAVSKFSLFLVHS